MSKAFWEGFFTAVLQPRPGRADAMESSTVQLALERRKIAVGLATQTLKSLLVINGGAAIGILTFYGNVLTKMGVTTINKWWITGALFCFAFGVFVAVLANGFAFSEAILGSGQGENQAIRKAIWIGRGSAGLFLLGIVLSALAFVQACKPL